MSRVVDFHRLGFNCAESIVKAYNEEFGRDVPVKLASAFGGGMCSGSTCGAITGAMLILGDANGRDDSFEMNNTRGIANAIMRDVMDKYHTTDCIILKRNGVSCDEIIEYMYNRIIEEIK